MRSCFTDTHRTTLAVIWTPGDTYTRSNRLLTQIITQWTAFLRFDEALIVDITEFLMRQHFHSSRCRRSPIISAENLEIMVKCDPWRGKSDTGPKDVNETAATAKTKRTKGRDQLPTSHREAVSVRRVALRLDSQELRSRAKVQDRLGNSSQRARQNKFRALGLGAGRENPTRSTDPRLPPRVLAVVLEVDGAAWTSLEATGPDEGKGRQCVADGWHVCVSSHVARW